MPCRTNAEAAQEFKTAMEAYLHGKPRDNFHAILYHLIQKADPENLAAIRAGFPLEVKIVEQWKLAPNGDDFLRHMGAR